MKKNKQLTLKRCIVLAQPNGEVAQLARASHWQCEGQEFESLLLHEFSHLGGLLKSYRRVKMAA